MNEPEVLPPISETLVKDSLDSALEFLRKQNISEDLLDVEIIDSNGDVRAGSNGDSLKSDQLFQLVKSNPDRAKQIARDALVKSQIAIFEYASAQYKRINRLGGLMDNLEAKFNTPAFLSALKPVDAANLWKTVDQAVNRSVTSLQDINKMVANITALNKFVDSLESMTEKASELRTPSNNIEFENIKSAIIAKLKELDGTKVRKE